MASALSLRGRSPWQSHEIASLTLAMTLYIICYFCSSAFAWEEGYVQVPGVVHIHTVISGGTKTIQEYAAMAEERGIGIVIITDHDTAKYEYGIGFRKIFKKVVEEDSVFKFGIDKYFELIKQTNERNPDVMVIDGVESFPFYYWTGSYFKKNLMLNNRDKHMLVIGLDSPETYKNMPLIANGIARYDQYHGENYVLPYQDLINYVHKKGGLTFWAHPEHEEVVNVKGVRAVTKPYHEDLLRTDGYTGFSVFYEGYNKIGRPGGVWDKVLMEYCSGRREKPVWAIGELDDHGMGDRDLIDVMTIFLLKKKNHKEALDALREGRVYAVRRGSMKHSMRLEDFSAKGERDSNSNFNPVIHTKIDYFSPPTLSRGGFTFHKWGGKKGGGEGEDKNGITAWIIRNGKIVWEEKGTSPFSIDFRDTSYADGVASRGKVYYRLDISDEDGCHIISNPIFLK